MHQTIKSIVVLLLLALGAVTAAFAGDDGTQPVQANLPPQKLGIGDLVSVFVYDATDLSRTARIGDDGAIRLPMLRDSIAAAERLPAEVERRIAEALRQQGLIPDPIVNVTVLEYRSRPVRVLGAVKSPTTFQAVGNVSLMDALARAGGFAPDAGSEVILQMTERNAQSAVERVTKRIAMTDLASNADAGGILLQGGEEIFVPPSGKIYIAGNIEKPGVYLLNEARSLTVMQALAQAGGLRPFASKQAYIYRQDAGKDTRSEVPVPLSGILDRKAADVTLSAGDIFYVPDNKGKRVTVGVLEKLLQFGSTAGATAMVYSAYPGH